MNFSCSEIKKVSLSACFESLLFYGFCFFVYVCLFVFIPLLLSSLLLLLLAAMSSQARKPKVKWTEPMNKDVLECKTKAQELVSSENPPCNENGRKRAYIDVMKELWDDMGYKNLQLKSQNLRDQASRLEKIRNNGTDLSIRERSVEDLGNITSTSEYSSQQNIEKESQNNQNRESGNANSPARGLNLHSAEPQQIPESRVTMGDWPDVSDDVPECLPNYTTVNLPATVNWGRNSDGGMITITTATIDDAYNEVTTWRKTPS